VIQRNLEETKTAMKAIQKLLFITLALALAVSAMAQGRRFGFGGGFGPASVINRDEVKEELKLTDEQKTKISDLADASQSKRREMMQSLGIDFRNMSDDNRKKMQEAMQKMNSETLTEIKGILTADQYKRLREISIQAEGASAIADPEFQKDLSVTDEQKAKVATLQKKQQDAMRELFQKMQDGEMDREGMREAMTKNGEIMKAEMAKLLSEEQKAKLKALSGAPFKLKEDAPGGGI
jgi:Spy/CpxP family protein refolding chaperone